MLTPLLFFFVTPSKRRYGVKFVLTSKIFVYPNFWSQFSLVANALDVNFIVGCQAGCPAGLRAGKEILGPDRAGLGRRKIVRAGPGWAGLKNFCSGRAGRAEKMCSGKWQNKKTYSKFMYFFFSWICCPVWARAARAGPKKNSSGRAALFSCPPERPWSGSHLWSIFPWSAPPPSWNFSQILNFLFLKMYLSRRIFSKVNCFAKKTPFSWNSGLTNCENSFLERKNKNKSSFS